MAIQCENHRSSSEPCDREVLGTDPEYEQWESGTAFANGVKNVYWCPEHSDSRFREIVDRTYNPEE